MPAGSQEPTPYPDVNAVLSALLVGVQAALGDTLVGVYLHGSAATGDLQPGRSDIDFLVATRGELPENRLAALEAMHSRLTASGLRWATVLEGSYIPQGALRRYDPAHARHPALSVDGTFAVDEHGIDGVIVRHRIREEGIVLAGPDPRSLIDPVNPDDLRDASRGILAEWWAPQVDDHSRLHAPAYHAYAILTMCRLLFTLRFGQVVSKSAAATWARDELCSTWTSLIDRANAWREGMPMDDLDGALALIRFALQSSRPSACVPAHGCAAR